MQGLSGFVVKSVRHCLEGSAQRIDINLDLDPRFKRRCSCCKLPGRIHDRRAEREWQFVPLWGIPVFLHYAPRRVICAVSGAPTVEAMPWNQGKSPYAIAYKIFLARWARRLSWKETAEVFHASVSGVSPRITTIGPFHRLVFSAFADV